MVGLAPTYRRRKQPEGREPRPAAADYLVRVAAYEVPARVGLVELLAEDLVPQWSLEVLGHVRQEPGDDGVGVKHQVLAHESGRVGQTVGVAVRLGKEEKPRRPDAVRGHDDRPCRLVHTVAVRVDVAGPGDSAVRSGGYVRDAAFRPDLDAHFLRLRQVRNVGRRLGAHHATVGVWSAVVAGRAAVVPRRVDVVVRRPPVPAQFVERSGHRLAVGAQRQRGHGPLRPRWIRRIAGDAGTTHHAVIQVVPRLELFVGEWPVVGYPVKGLDPEVGRVKPGRVRGPVDRAAAHGVVHERSDVRLAVVDRIVFRQAANVGIDIPRCAGLQLPVVTGRRVVFRPQPRPLLQDDHFEAVLGQPPGRRAAGRPGANDQHIDRAIISILIRSHVSCCERPHAHVCPTHAPAADKIPLRQRF